MIGRRWGPCGRWPRQLSDAKDGRAHAGYGAPPLAHRAGVVRVGLRLGSSERDPVIAGGAGFTEGVVRERHGDDGVGGMAGAEDVVDAAKPILGGYVAYCVQKLLSRKSGHGTRLLVEVDLLTKE